MIQRTNPFHTKFLSMHRRLKKVVMVCADIIALCVALWSGYALRLSEWWPQSYLAEALPLFIIVPILGVLVFTKLGLYRAVVRFMNTRAIKAVNLGVILLTLSLYALAYYFQIKQFPRSVPINFGLAALIYVGGSRLLVRSYYHWLIKNFVQKEPVLIYGAGGAGVQLANMLEGGAEFAPVGFLDDDASLWRSSIAGLPVYDPKMLEKVIEDQAVTHLLLALPNATADRRRAVLEYLTQFPIKVKTMPSMPDIISGTALDNVRDVEVEDLLGREPVPPKAVLIERSLAGKNVLVTGAGGSIGSEIARQAMLNGASCLVLFDVSEYALYTIDQELTKSALESGIEVRLIPMLGSVMEKERLTSLMKRFDIHTVYHAAAYKHVPLVEHNVIQGLTNNSLGTFNAAQAAVAADVERFVLISTDKAVRPTNVMGATKRLAELILQDMAGQKLGRTIFSMVRFGNVLGSSGSVVPLFKQQILAGGPVTVTHPEINRFFMTIPEAATLVIQAGSMAEGGDVFVLDMGEPVKITDLAERMIRLSGKMLKTAETPNGDIAIEFAGLRPGEKLYEELLIGDNVTGTEHSKIMRAEEERLVTEDLERLLSKLGEAITAHNSEAARTLLQEAVSGFKPTSVDVDWLSRSDLSSSSTASNGEIH